MKPATVTLILRIKRDGQIVEETATGVCLQTDSQEEIPRRFEGAKRVIGHWLDDTESELLKEAAECTDTK